MQHKLICYLSLLILDVRGFTLMLHHRQLKLFVRGCVLAGFDPFEVNPVSFELFLCTLKITGTTVKSQLLRSVAQKQRQGCCTGCSLAKAAGVPKASLNLYSCGTVMCSSSFCNQRIVQVLLVEALLKSTASEQSEVYLTNTTCALTLTVLFSAGSDPRSMLAGL